MAQQWSGQTGGTYGMQKALVSIFRYVDVRVMYAVMNLWLIWYIIVRPSATRSIYRYHRRWGRSRWASIWATYRSFYTFGEAIIDRFAVYAGRHFDYQVDNSEHFYGRTNQPEGFILLFSHVGNSEMAAYSLSTPDKRMNILAFGGESEVVMEQRAKVLAKNNMGMITVFPNDMSHIYRINEILQAGEVLAIAGDRKMAQNDKTITCTILGGEAQLPAGPFILSASLRRPVVLCFVIKEKWNKYHIFTEQLQVNTTLPRHERPADLARQYAERIEQMTRRYPYQWFNFYDFWA